MYMDNGNNNENAIKQFVNQYNRLAMVSMLNFLKGLTQDDKDNPQSITGIIKRNRLPEDVALKMITGCKKFIPKNITKIRTNKQLLYLNNINTKYIKIDLNKSNKENTTITNINKCQKIFQ